jgi:hypothetical protein
MEQRPVNLNWRHTNACLPGRGVLTLSERKA